MSELDVRARKALRLYAMDYIVIPRAWLSTAVQLGLGPRMHWFRTGALTHDGRTAHSECWIKQDDLRLIWTMETILELPGTTK